MKSINLEICKPEFHDFGFVKGLNILIGRPRRAKKCINCGMDRKLIKQVNEKGDTV